MGMLWGRRSSVFADIIEVDNNLKVLEIEPLRFNKGDLDKAFTRPFPLKRSCKDDLYFTFPEL